MQLLWAVDHGLQSTSKRMNASLGLTGPQRLVLRLVGRFPGIPAGNLADLLFLHPSTLTGVLRRLEERGLLRRKKDPADGRRALFELTAKGKKLDVPSKKTVESAVARALEDVNPRDAAAAKRVLTALHTALVDVED
ncbi:MAG: MarR family transcriptional regulator [Deltaproteobacteria bacterium]|nr:MarR family transcriptional regulator [Deltaproteobacteria bacterium]